MRFHNGLFIFSPTDSYRLLLGPTESDGPLLENEVRFTPDWSVLVRGAGFAIWDVRFTTRAEVRGLSLKCARERARDDRKNPVVEFMIFRFFGVKSSRGGQTSDVVGGKKNAKCRMQSAE